MCKRKERPHCSFCQSENVKVIAPFGTAQLVRQFYCHDCKSVFEYIRWRSEKQDKHIENARAIMNAK
ncbi:PaaD-like zinc ribbon domain-containing protein [Halalkalibacter krulwichiae]|uniref:PaaD zinc beta ribbon domain-containing protein n=1 Tax=Halalkalibacter krulwichiae TaxID=199441 RepID=A0A1X9MDX6_9BACI|nr:hypothetical protein [Halalkalibacter krulwichiae]ARK29751.1 hypothetical protein BkAM31D_07685 [Halalkalibacter krulwichiae]